MPGGPNNNFFNWYITSKSDYFIKALHIYLRQVTKRPRELLNLFSKVNISGQFMTVAGIHEFNFYKRFLYKIFVLAYYRHLSDTDQFGRLKELSEPEYGLPITIKQGNVQISQDLCSSYDEYSFVRQSINIDYDNATILDIGAGYGRTLYCFKKLHPNLKAIIIDIPPAIILSLNYMVHVFPEAKIITPLDVESGNIPDDYDFMFLLPHQSDILRIRKVDVALNVSSFHEMTMEQIDTYYDLINGVAGYFYTKQWIVQKNSFDDLTLPAIAYPSRTNWKCLNARIHPIHSNFIEAAFKIN